MTIGEKIKQARKKAGYTQKELGEKLGISQVRVAQYENGIRNPKIETIKKIAEALNVEIIDLIPGLTKLGDAIETDINAAQALLNKLPKMGLPEEIEKKYQEWAISTITEKQSRRNELEFLTSNNTIADYVQEIDNFLSRSPEYKALFDSIMHVKKEDVEFIKTLLDRLK